MKLYMSEHDAERTMPALETTVFCNSKGSGMLLLPHTRAIRLHADEDCLIGIDKEEPKDWTRLAADISEWFSLAKDHVGVRVWVKAESDED